jgi:hypothetical protein
MVAVKWILRSLGWGWIAVVAAIILGDIVLKFFVLPFSVALFQAMQTLSPFNVEGYLLFLMVVTPGIGALLLAFKIK